MLGTYWVFHKSWAFFTLARAVSAVNGGLRDILEDLRTRPIEVMFRHGYQAFLVAKDMEQTQLHSGVRLRSESMSSSSAGTKRPFKPVVRIGILVYAIPSS